MDPEKTAKPGQRQGAQQHEGDQAYPAGAVNVDIDQVRR